MEGFAEYIHSTKHRLPGETFREGMSRVASALSSSPQHFERLRDHLLTQLILPAGRIQLAAGSPQDITLFNCYVSGTVQDSMNGIMCSATDAATTMRKGGGLGTSFSTIRPRGARITTLNSPSSGAVSFMGIFNAVGETVSSVGERRGAQMGTLRVSHPDVEEFIGAKSMAGVLSNFNVSVAVTDEFMKAVEADTTFNLEFDGIVYKQVRARSLWDKIMRATWDWAEPGILFIDRINEMNNLQYCEDIEATNPCGEQPLPPHGACLLASYNLTKYKPGAIEDSMLDLVRAMDNAIDVSKYPLAAQEAEAHDKRRMGIGVTGLANYIETEYGYSYGSDGFLFIAEKIFKELTYSAYRASIELAKERGPFDAFDKDSYLASEFVKTLPKDIQQGIEQYGIRNSHLVSFAPTGTISLTAGNVSSGIEPVFSYEYTRAVKTTEGDKIFKIQDYAYKNFGVRGKTAGQCSVDDHLEVLALATRYSDSAVSKTINIGDDVQWDEFKDVYMKAWKLGCKGCTTFRAAGKRFGILQEGSACYIDPETGDKECS